MWVQLHHYLNSPYNPPSKGTNMQGKVLFVEDNEEWIDEVKGMLQSKIPELEEEWQLLIMQNYGTTVKDSFQLLGAHQIQSKFC